NRNRNRFRCCRAPGPLSTAQTTLPRSLIATTTRLHDPVLRVRIPSRSVPFDTDTDTDPDPDHASP
ncbi:MAG: hypothetical protein PHG55_13060, partial [Verrucomicrobiota bacterium]|nr:hypothetical protein [Verrucomicrobiota bacterium]